MSELLSAGDIQIDVEGFDLASAVAILAERGRQMRAAPVAAEAAGTIVLRWHLGGESFALPLADIAQVVPLRRLTPVPGAPPGLIGLASVRRRVVNVMDVAGLLGVDADTRDEGHLLVLKGPAPRLAVRVDRAEGVEMLVEDMPSAGALTAQVASRDGGRLTLVDTARLIEALGPGGGQ